MSPMSLLVSEGHFWFLYSIKGEDSFHYGVDDTVCMCVSCDNQYPSQEPVLKTLQQSLLSFCQSCVLFQDKTSEKGLLSPETEGLPVYTDIHNFLHFSKMDGLGCYEHPLC